MLQLTFSWYDYILFMMTLGMSLVIGIYFGLVKKQDSAEHYLLGGKEMKILPVAMSLVASCISGLTILGVPADVYKYGINYGLLVPDFLFVVAVAYYIYFPVFYKIQIKSMNEYLKLRFNENVQKFSSAVNTIMNTLYLPIVIYIPALAVSQATGFNIHLITSILCGICIIYTTLGGLKAVVWVDTLQLILMLIAIITVFVIGVISTGGFAEIWHVAQENGRLNVDLGLDFTKRDTLLSGTLGLGIMWCAFVSINQVCVQKCLSLPEYKDVKYTLIIFALGMMAIVSFSVFTGLIIYVRYKDCDPLNADLIERSDQLLPYFVLDVARKIPGLSGLFIAGICSAALSTMAAVMNSMSCTIYEDFLSKYMKKNISQKKVSFILKMLVIIIGVVNTALVFIVEHLGGLLALSLSLSGGSTGTLLGLFSVGMLVPVANSIGVLWGGIVSMTIMTWIVFGQQWYQFQGKVIYPILPLSTNGCINLENMTMNEQLTHLPYMSASDEDESIFALYKISFYWYAILGCLIFVVVTIPVSYLTKNKSKPVHRDLLSPIIYFLIPQEEKSYLAVQVNDKDMVER